MTRDRRPPAAVAHSESVKLIIGTFDVEQRTHQGGNVGTGIGGRDGWGPLWCELAPRPRRWREQVCGNL